MSEKSITSDGDERAVDTQAGSDISEELAAAFADVDPKVRSDFGDASCPLNHPPVFTGEKSRRKPPDYITDMADGIRVGWHKATADIMDVAGRCADAARCLSRTEKEALYPLLPFNRATFSKLVKVGRDGRLKSPVMQRQLPPNYSIIYAVAQLDDDEFEAACEENIICPELKRADLSKWVRERRGEPTRADDTPALSRDQYAAFTGVSIDKFSPDVLKRLDTELLALAEKYGIELIGPRKLYAKAASNQSGFVS